MKRRDGALAARSTRLIPRETSQEIVGLRLLQRNAPGLLWGRFEYRKLALEVLVELENSRHIATSNKKRQYIKTQV